MWKHGASPGKEDSRLSGHLTSTLADLCPCLGGRWDPAVDAVLADSRPCGHFLEAHSALISICASPGGCGYDVVDRHARKTSLAEVQDWDAVGRTELALYAADLAYLKSWGLCGLV